MHWLAMSTQIEVSKHFPIRIRYVSALMKFPTKAGYDIAGWVLGMDVTGDMGNCMEFLKVGAYLVKIKKRAIANKMDRYEVSPLPKRFVPCQPTGQRMLFRTLAF